MTDKKATEKQKAQAEQQARLDAQADLTRGLEMGVRHRDYSDHDSKELGKLKQKTYDEILGVVNGYPRRPGPGSRPGRTSIRRI